MSLRRADWIGDDGHKGVREWAHSKMRATVAIPQTEDGRWVLTREWRPSLDAWCIQFPGGIINDGERPKEAAARECLEETGYRVLSMADGRFQPLATSPGFSDELLWFFRCTVENQPSGGKPHPAEPMTVHAVQPSDLEKFLQDKQKGGEHVSCWLLFALG